MLLNNTWLDSEGKGKIPKDKWKHKHSNTKSMRHSESSPKGEIHSLPQEMREISYKQSKLTPEWTRKRTTKKAQTK